jgi:hypothetical protein
MSLMGREPVFTNVGFMAAQLDRQVSGTEFSGLVGRTRPIAAGGGFLGERSVHLGT